MLTKKFLALTVLASAALALTACSGAADKSGDGGEGKSYTLKLASYQPPGAAEPRATAQWAEQIEKATDGRVKVEFFYQEALLPGAETLQGVADGRADMGYIADAYYPAELPLTNIAGLPFMTSSPEAQGRTFADLYESNEAYRAEWKKQGVHVLTWAPVPPNVVAVKEPAASLRDLTSRKIRAIGFSALAFEKSGISPVAISQSEVYEALQRGVVDGTSGGSFDILTDRDYQEVAPHFMDLNSGNYAVTMNVINLKLWESFPKDIQEAITNANNEYLDLYLESLATAEEAACGKLTEAGGTITILPESDTGAWAKKAGSEVRAMWAKDAAAAGAGTDPDAFFEEYSEVLAGHETEATYEPALHRCAAQK